MCNFANVMTNIDAYLCLISESFDTQGQALLGKTRLKTNIVFCPVRIKVYNNFFQHYLCCNFIGDIKSQSLTSPLRSITCILEVRRHIFSLSLLTSAVIWFESYTECPCLTKKIIYF